jgi:hypothetical protein
VNLPIPFPFEAVILIEAVILNEVKDPVFCLSCNRPNAPFIAQFADWGPRRPHKPPSGINLSYSKNHNLQCYPDPQMNLRIAAIRSGSEPVRKLSSGSFHRWLETPLACPKCDATYNLAVDWDQSTDRWFPETSRPLITLLKKAIHMGHSTDHRVTHFETEGVIVESITPAATR